MKLPTLQEAIARAQRDVEGGQRPSIEDVAVILRAVKNLPEIARLCDSELATAGRHRQTVALALNVKEYLDCIPPTLWRTDSRPTENP